MQSVWIMQSRSGIRPYLKIIVITLLKRVVSSSNIRLGRNLGWLKIKVPIENDGGAIKRPSVNIVLKYLLGHAKRQDKVPEGKITCMAIWVSKGRNWE